MAGPTVPGVIAITDLRLVGGREALLRRCGELLEAGVPAIMLREKALPARELHALARVLRASTREHGALLLVNDRVDVALAVRADGVQVGQAGLPAEAARRLLPVGMRLGVSCHDEAEIRAAAEAGADYVLLAPVFDPASKPKERPPLGLEGLRRGCDAGRIAGVPVVALGGITAGNAADVLAAGASGVAGIGCFFGRDARRDEVEGLLGALREHPRQ